MHLHKVEDGTCVPDEIEPVGEIVTHCNSHTNYELIEHVYQPDDCDECKRVQALFSECEFSA